MPKLEIKPVSGKREFRDFLQVPWTVYADDPNWIPPLLFERKQAFSPKHPFFDHARWQPFVAYEDGEPVGRITAQIDSLYLERYQSATGFFGYPDAINETVLAALVAAAESWLVGEGMKQVIGPFNLGIWQEIGLLVEGFTTPPYIMMGHASPFMGGAMEAQGYVKAVDTLAYTVNCDAPVPASIKRVYDRAAKRFSRRMLNRKRMDEDLETMRQILNDAWQDNWGFVPFTEDEFRTVGRELLALVPDDFIQITELNDEPVAFAAIIPNVNEAIADLNGRLFPLGWAKLLWRLKVRYPRTGRVPLMGIRSQYHQSRLGAALAYVTFFSVQGPALSKGIEEVEMSWILEGNKGMRSMAESLGGTITKRYRLYQKALASPES